MDINKLSAPQKDSPQSYVPTVDWAKIQGSSVLSIAGGGGVGAALTALTGSIAFFVLGLLVGLAGPGRMYVQQQARITAVRKHISEGVRHRERERATRAAKLAELKAMQAANAKRAAENLASREQRRSPSTRR